MNQGIFCGRLGRDSDLRTTPGGHNVLNFSLAVDVGFGDKKETLWVGCAIWGERAEKLHPYLKKGGRVTVSGDVGLRMYESNGATRAEITLNVQRLTLQGDAQRREPEQAATAGATYAPTGAAAVQAAAASDGFDDSIPF